MGRQHSPIAGTKGTLRTAQIVNSLAEDSMHHGDYLAPRPSHEPTTAESRSRLARQKAGAIGASLPPGWKVTTPKSSRKRD